MIRLARHIAEAVATGAWATPARLLVYPGLLLAAYVLAAFALVLTGDGNVDASGRAIGADYGMMWAAGQTALSGRPQEVFSLGVQAALQNKLFGEAAGFTPWHYPPVFLLIATPLAALPYLAALAAWQSASFVAYLWAIRSCVAGAAKLAGPALLLGAAFPAVFINAAHGQNGFLTTGLLVGGVLLLRTQPIASGALFALLAYKPQFCLLIPVLMLAQGDWRVLASAVLTGCALIAATVVAFGSGVFHAFVASIPDAGRLTIETGATGWEKIQSVYAGLRMLGLGVDGAMLVQAAVALLVASAVAWVWRSNADVRLKQALVFAGVLLTTPYCIDYDMVLLAPALALLALHGIERGFARWEISLLALAFLTPIVARTIAGATHAPVGALVTLALFGWTLRRAMMDASVSVRTLPGPPLPSAS
jgi:alpha-1,2-mannosyltransferase